MKKMIAFGITISALVIATGCTHSGPKEPAPDYVGTILGFIDSKMEETREISFSCKWYRSIHQKWPSNKIELEDFLSSHQVPISLEQYEEMEFITQPNDDLKIKITNSDKSSKSLTIRPQDEEAVITNRSEQYR